LPLSLIRYGAQSCPIGIGGIVQKSWVLLAMINTIVTAPAYSYFLGKPAREVQD
jgi:hypothetical protein